MMVWRAHFVHNQLFRSQGITEAREVYFHTMARL